MYLPGDTTIHPKPRYQERRTPNQEKQRATEKRISTPCPPHPPPSPSPSKPPSPPTLLQTLTPPNHNLPILLLPSIHPSPYNPSLAPQIASLSLHPTLEALLHILNHDLSSAHFLVRHMPSSGEGMLVHALLHRVEGDLDNAAAWYGDASTCAPVGGEGGMWDFVWGRRGAVEEFLGRVREFKAQDFGRDWREGEREALRTEGQEEVRRMVQWCCGKFGIGELRDASEVWTEKSEEEREMQRGMVVGGEGWRKF